MKVLENKPEKISGEDIRYSIVDTERADNLRKLRKRKHITREHAAFLLGVNPFMLEDIESAKRRFEDNDGAMKILEDFNMKAVTLERVKDQTAKRQKLLQHKGSAEEKIENLEKKVKELQTEHIKIWRRIIHLEKRIC